MTARTAASAFDAVSIEGGLLPAEWLARIANLKVPQQGPTDYGVPKGLNLRDELGRYWRIANAHWQEFAKARDTAADQRTLAGRFTANLLREVFGAADFESATQPAIVADHSYPVSAVACGGKLPVVVGDPRQSLDQRDRAYGDTGRQRSAFGLLQDYLNAEDAALWGIACNGTTLRVARDNASLTRPAWIEADLERIFAEDRFADFSLLWLIIHASRFGRSGQPPEQCPLEAWRDASREEGTRARDQLRNGVTQALLDIGQGFLAHPDNGALRAKLVAGDLTRHAYFRQLLRLVYRLIFLLTIEERGLLHPKGADEKAIKLYAEGYSLHLLAERARRRRAYDRHADLWQGLAPVFKGLAEGQPLLALPALGGLFAAGQCPDLDTAQLPNRALLAALDALCWLRIDGALTRTNWRDMKYEEFGSIYESLLELRPKITNEARHFGFVEVEQARGNERKVTGSYYTPDVLVQQLLDSALEPVIEQRLAGAVDSEAALLSITVCDPACGSGHFLLAAAFRLADRLARARAGGTPGGDEYRHALRDVVARCLYGVDRNPMAVELCKVALWLEAVDPGRPLGFLDAHIRCGNALVGVHDLSVLRAGIPNGALTPLKDILSGSGFDGNLVDDRTAASVLKRRNSGERKTPVLPLAGLNLTIPEETNHLLQSLSSDELTVRDVEGKRSLYESARADGTVIWRLSMACDLWTAAFFSVKRPVERIGAEPTPTSDVVWRFLSDRNSLSERVAAAATELRREYRFFHWPLEFPDVFERGGFALVLGNPPWETMSPDAKEYFAEYGADISGLSPDAQKERIEQLLEAPGIREDWEQHARELYAVVRFIKESGRYRLFAEGNLGKGDFNVYRQFVELALTFTSPGGVASQIVPENFYNGANAAAIRAEVLVDFCLTALYGFENAREVWFKGIDTRMKFALYVAFRGEPARAIPVAFSLNSLDALRQLPLRKLMLPLDLVREFSPEALAVMEFSNQLEIDIAKSMYGRFPKLGEDIASCPMWKPLRELDMGTDNGLFTSDSRGWPLYQGSMVTHHDYRAKGYVSGHGRNVVWRDLPFGDPDKTIIPQWRVLEGDIPAKISDRIRRYRIGFCDVGNATNQRALMAALIPPYAVCGHKVPTIEFDPFAPDVMMLWLAVANSLAMDFIVRMKVALTMAMSLLATLPFPRQVEAGQASARAAALATKLSCAGPEMNTFRTELAKLASLADCDLSPCENPEERARLMAELDVVVARDIFGLDRRQMEYLLEPRDILGSDCTAETFAALRRAEEREFGEYRTRRLVLEAWGAQEAGTVTVPSRVAPQPEAPMPPLRRTMPYPSYSPARVPCCEAEDWLAGLVCDVLLRFGPISEATLRLVLTSSLPAASSGVRELSTWAAQERMTRLPAIIAWFRDLSVIPRSGDLRIVAGADLSVVLGDSRTQVLAAALIGAHRAQQAELDVVLSAETLTTAAPDPGALRDAARGKGK